MFRVLTRGKDTDRVSEAQNSLRETQAPGQTSIHFKSFILQKTTSTVVELLPKCPFLQMESLSADAEDFCAFAFCFLN